MEFTNKFRVALPLEDAWQLMLDVPRIMPCLPGAVLSEVLGPDKYRGSVTVKLGPIKLSFDGKAELVKKDDSNHIAWLQGSGLDPKGRGAAESQFTFALQPVDGGTEVTVNTQLQLFGAVAQYGRGSGMMAEVASHILAQFERNLANSLSSFTPAAVVSVHESARANMGSEQMHLTSANTANIANTANSANASFAGQGAHIPVMSSTEAQTMVYQAQALLGQAQSVLASTQAALMHLQSVGAIPPTSGTRPAAELNMLSIGLKAIWWQIKRSLAALFGRGR
ncbi:MAG: SRPBCC family protein [Betaproteobacteria bacterium]